MNAFTEDRRDLINRSRIDQRCPVHGSLTTYCDIDDEPIAALQFAREHAGCSNST